MQFDVAITTPRGTYRQTQASIINVVTPDGQRGILPNHVPIVASLAVSRMTMDEGGVRETYAVSGGTLFFRDNRCSVLTPAIENARDIDVDRARAARERALARLGSADGSIDVARAKSALRRAENRLMVAGEALGG